jgi:gluconokinase
LDQRQPAVLACSALKRDYRRQLSQDNENSLFVYLRGDFEQIRRRMVARRAHYFKPDLLRSQFDDLEEPADDEALIVAAGTSVGQIVETILSWAGLSPAGKAKM